MSLDLKAKSNAKISLCWFIISIMWFILGDSMVLTVLFPVVAFGYMIAAIIHWRLHRKSEARWGKFKDDYNRFKSEISNDMSSGKILFSDTLKIKRDEKPLWLEFRPINNYYYEEDQIAEPYEEMQVLDVYKELEKRTRPIGRG